MLGVLVAGHRTVANVASRAAVPLRLCGTTAGNRFGQNLMGIVGSITHISQFVGASLDILMVLLIVCRTANVCLDYGIADICEVKYEQRTVLAAVLIDSRYLDRNRGYFFRGLQV